jgi:hypothetical protein
VHVRPGAEPVLQSRGRGQVDLRGGGPVVLGEVNRGVGVRRGRAQGAEVGQAAADDGRAQRGHAPGRGVAARQRRHLMAAGE